MLTLDLVMDGAPQSVMEGDTAISDVTVVPRTYVAEVLSEQCVNAMLTDVAGAPPTMHMHCWKNQPQTKMRSALSIIPKTTRFAILCRLTTWMDRPGHCPHGHR